MPDLRLLSPTAFMVGQAPPYGYCGRESAAGRRKRRFACLFTVSQATVVWCRRRHAHGMLALRMSGINARPTFAVTNRFHGGASPTLRILRAGIRRRSAKAAVCVFIHRFAGDCSVVSAPTRTRNAGIANVGHKCPTYVCCHQPLSWWGKPHPTDIAGGNSPRSGESGGRVSCPAIKNPGIQAGIFAKGGVIAR